MIDRMIFALPYRVWPRLVATCTLVFAAALCVWAAPAAQAEVYDLTPLAQLRDDVADAFAAWERGDSHRAKALTLLATAAAESHDRLEAASLSLRAGQWASELGRTSEAAKHFGAAAAHPALAGPAQMRLAAMYARRNKPALALSALEGVPPGCPDYAKARVQSAKLLFDAGDFERALKAAREAEMDGASDEETVRARLLQADILWEAGRRPEATRIWESVWWQADAGSGAAKRALIAHKKAPDAIDQLLHDLVHLGRTVSTKQEKSLRKRIRRLKSKSRALEPLSEALLLRPKRKEKDSAADAALAALAATRKSDRLRPWALWVAAETVRRLDRDIEAVGYYRELSSQFPHHPFAPGARYDAGFLLTNQGLVVEAQTELRTLLESHPNAADAAAATWELGWGAYLSGDGPAAERYFQQLLRRHGAQRARSRGFMAEQALYWLARSRESREETERAVEAYRELVDRYPLTYYATLAQGRLEGLGRNGRLEQHSDGEACSEAMAFPLKVGIQTHPALDTAVALHRLGDAEGAWEELWHRLEAGQLPQQGLLMLLGLCKLRGSDGCTDWLLRAYGRVGPLPSVETAGLWRDAYPVRYEHAAAAVAEENHVEPQLVLALIRHESGFNPKVKSYAGAYGLMQLLPSVGREIAKTLLGESGLRARQLLDPDTNVKLGTRYLREILNFYGDNLPLALAAYNAGPYAVKKWLERQGHLASDEFVEVMPYRGARAYAKKVLTTYAVYRYLYCAGPADGAPAFRVPNELPSKLGPFMTPDDTAATSRSR